MSEPFNPTHAVRFELGRGRVSLRGAEGAEGSPALLILADALRDLCDSAGTEATTDFGRRLGTEIGRRAASRLPAASSVAAVVEQLGGELALSGLGSLGAEVWGQALVFSVTGSPLGAGGDRLLGAVLEGALQRALGRDAAALPVDRTDDKARLVIVSRPTAARVQQWLTEGVSWGEALARLSQPAGPGNQAGSS